ncbi:unnamed protein product [Scytosiphon promiscuus]
MAAPGRYYDGERPPQSSTCRASSNAGVRCLASAFTLLLFSSKCGAFVPQQQLRPSHDHRLSPSQGRRGSWTRRPMTRLHAAFTEDGTFPESEVGVPRNSQPTSPKEEYATESLPRRAPLSRRNLLENARASATGALGALFLGGPSRKAAISLRGAVGAGVPAAVGSWGAGLGQGGVPSAEAFGGPSKPLSRCLVNAINAREFCKRLEADLAAGRNEQECRGMVKGVLRGLTLQESVKDAVLYLPGGKRQAAGDAGQSAVEYLASVVEFDAWDKLDKDWTSNVALRNMTPENVMFVRMALEASGSALDTFLKQFDRADVDSARELYRTYFLPAEEKE